MASGAMPRPSMVILLSFPKSMTTPGQSHGHPWYRTGHRPRQHCVTNRKLIDPDLISSNPVTSVACVESERVDTGAASQKVIFLAADQRVRTGATNQCVAAVSPPKQVGARSLVNTVIRTGRA